MILVILAICIALLVVGLILTEKLTYDYAWAGGLLASIGIVIGVIALIVTVFLIVGVSDLSVIDDRIAMYQEENAKIETQIAATVQEYQQYETDIFKDVTPDSAITLVALYPELKSDTLVQKQIEVYIENNEKIKELKEEQINGTVSKWWLYFGG